MKIELLSEDKEKLLAIVKKSSDKKISDRIRIIILLSDGFSINELSKIFFHPPQTIREWIERYKDRKSIDSWFEDDYVPYEGKLTQEELNKVENFVNNNIITDCKEVIEYIKKEFNKIFTPSGMAILLKRLNFTYKDVRIIPGQKPDIKEQEEFIKSYEELKENLKENEVILFADGCHPQHNTVTGKCWIKIGEEKTIESNTGRQRINIQGAYDPINQDVIIKDYKTINAESIIDFIKTLLKKYPNCMIHIILDNAKYQKNKKIAEYIKDKKVKLIFLPTYAPNLNLIERLWKFGKKNVIINKYYSKFKEFKNTLLDFYNSLEDKKDQLAKFIGQRLHLIT